MDYKTKINQLNTFPTLKDGVGFTFNDTIDELLFWDTDITKLNLDSDKKYIIQRIIDQGSDWLQFLLMTQYYGREIIIENIKAINNFSDKAISFCNVYFDIPKLEMMSYRIKKHINY